MIGNKNDRKPSLKIKVAYFVSDTDEKWECL